MLGDFFDQQLMQLSPDRAGCAASDLLPFEFDDCGDIGGGSEDQGLSCFKYVVYGKGMYVNLGDLFRECDPALHGCADEDVLVGWSDECAVLGNDTQVFCGTFGEVAVIIHSNYKVDSTIDRLFFHERVREVIAGLDGGKEGGFNGYIRNSGACSSGLTMHEGSLLRVDYNVQLGFDAFVGVDAESAGAAGKDEPYQAVSLSARAGSFNDTLTNFAYFAGERQLNAFRRSNEACHMLLQIVNGPLMTLQGLKYPVAPVNEVIIHGNLHEAWIGDNGVELRRIHGVVWFLMSRRFAAQPRTVLVEIHGINSIHILHSVPADFKPVGYDGESRTFGLR